jgi:hypothetical protein
MANPQARELILKLLSLEPGRDLSYDDFRIRYEDLFNFELDKASVSKKEFQVFKRLFDKVVWYSPFPDERARIANYIGEPEMEAAVAEARRALKIRSEAEHD